MNKKLCTSLAILAMSCAAWATDYTSWAKYRDLTLSTSGVTTTAVKKIPVLVRFNVTNQFDMFTGSTAALAGGADIRVTKSDGTTDIPFEVDNWTTGSAGSGALWVLLDSVPQNTASAYAIRVFWNKVGATTASAPSTVFSPSNGYLAVWHFNEAAGSPLVDASGSSLTATPGSGAGAAPTNNASSIIGVGKTFDGAAQYYQVGTDTNALSLNTDTGSYTITAWANPTSCSSARIAVIAKYANDNSTGTRQYALQTANTSTDWRMTEDPTSLSSTTTNNEYVADAVGGCIDGTWSYLVGSYSSSVAPTGDATGAAKLSLTVNAGTPVTGITASQGTGTSIGRKGQAFIGKIASNERYMNGSIDEITVSKVTRTADWISLSYNTQKSGATAITVGASVPPTAATVPDAPTNVTGTGGTSGQITVAWKAPVYTGGATITAYTAKAVQDTSKKCTTTGALTCNVTGLTNTTSYTFTVTATNSAGTSVASLPSTGVTGIFKSSTQQSMNVSMAGSSVVFHLPAVISAARISVMNFRGREVWNKKIDAGTRELIWDRTATNGSALTGVYFVRFTNDAPNPKVLAEAKVVLTP